MSVTINMKDNVAQLQRTPLYGLLYNWYAIADARGVAPTGWHVATMANWNSLQLEYDSGATNYNSTTAGGPVKETGTTHWDSPNTGATNISGFTALPAGERIFFPDYLGGPTCDYKHKRAVFLCSDERSSIYANSFVLYNDSAYFGWNDQNRSKGSVAMSVRLIRDTIIGWNEGDTITDYDGNIYHTVRIGMKIWAVENLATTHYNNGDPISEVTSNLDWLSLTTGALCAYNNDWSDVFKS